MLKRAIGYLWTGGFLLAVVGLTLVSGVLHGRLTNRWGSPSEMLVAAKRLEGFPQQFGSWELRESKSLSDTAVTMLQCAGYVHHIYVNRETGETVNLAILVGPTGPIAAHTPDICYSSREYEIQQPRQHAKVRPAEAPDEEFWALTLRAKGIHGELLRVYYAWRNDGVWTAPNRARFALAGQPYLYKIQLACPLPSNADQADTDPGRGFLEAFLPAAAGILVP